MVVPLGEDVGLLSWVLLAVLVLKDNGDGQALSLLEDLLVAALVGVGDIQFAVVVLEGVLRGSFYEVVHDEDGDAVVLPVPLVDLVEYLGGFVDLEADLPGIQVEDGLEESPQRFRLFYNRSKLLIFRHDLDENITLVLVLLTADLKHMALL